MILIKSRIPTHRLWRILILFLSTGFLIGYTPIAPASAACLVVSLGIFLASRYNFFVNHYAAFTFLILILGYFVSGKAERILQKKDPKQIVIDDILGQFIAVYDFHNSANPLYILLGFIFFRIIDNLKPFPIKIIERKEGALGIMGDDIFAGLYANILLRFAMLLV